MSNEGIYDISFYTLDAQVPRILGLVFSKTGMALGEGLGFAEVYLTHLFTPSAYFNSGYYQVLFVNILNHTGCTVNRWTNRFLRSNCMNQYEVYSMHTSNEEDAIQPTILESSTSGLVFFPLWFNSQIEYLTFEKVFFVHHPENSVVNTDTYHATLATQDLSIFEYESPQEIVN